MVDFLAGDVLHLVDQLFAAVQLRHGVDLHIAPIDFHQGIARNGNQRGRSCLRLGEYKNGVGSETFDVAGVSDGALTFVGAKNKPAFAGGVRFGCQPGLFVELVIDPVPSGEYPYSQCENQ